ncbi:hypothetical protein SD427_05230 [Chryseobacterium sp. JJR-5R]|uniref:hypothetical protein n=1 Tax=Chryseobacterium sp. JJR-5R TaxID=3093923 RepID=UPI002A75D126|nr:hypothetical protein [Chryseobacterium sp. JJR-5R]WPO83734.1 hypothetical protein SD427_05230 [Chryseobacterium sp. JJR-5R]
MYSLSRDVYYKGFSENVDKCLTYHLTSTGKYTSGTEDWDIVYSRFLTVIYLSIFIISV